MKILFLDFDGVLNSVGSFIYNNRQNRLGLTKTPSYKSFCPVSLSNLYYILEELPDLKIVVSSTWRKYNSLEQLKLIFNNSPIDSSRMIDKTPVSHDGYRGREIQEYLHAHPEVTEFVILDDDSDMVPYMSRLIKTDSRNGLTFSDAERVIELFGAKDEKED